MKKSTRLGACVALIFLLVGPSCWALELAEAKTSGWLGELPSGYLGLIEANAPPENAKALMLDINARRKAAYEKIAKKNSVPVVEVGEITAAKVIAKSKPGTYYQNEEGVWKQR